MENLNGNSPLDTVVCEQELENQPLGPLIAQEVQSQGEVEQVSEGLTLLAWDCAERGRD